LLPKSGEGMMEMDFTTIGGWDCYRKVVKDKKMSRGPSPRGLYFRRVVTIFPCDAAAVIVAVKAVTSRAFTPVTAIRYRMDG